jgi:putative phosphoesterase
VKELEDSGERVIGVIADTHGLLRPEAVDALEGVDLILHAGDIGAARILDALQVIGPVVAIRGNIDTGPWAAWLPFRETVKVGPMRIYLIHDVNDLEVDPVTVNFRVVVSGHSHKPSMEDRAGVLYLNPGSAGPRRFRLPVSVARLTMRGDGASAEIIELSV